MRLSVSFTGMCLFVPGPVGTMHVLMPRTGKHAGLNDNHPVHPHEVRMIYSRGHVGGDATKPPVERRIAGQLQFGTAGGGGQQSPELPDGVVDLTALTGDRVNLVNPPNVEFAVQLHGGSFMTADILAEWQFPRGPAVTMAHTVIWTTELEDAELRLSHPSFPLGQLTLRPICEDIEIFFGHLPPEEFAPGYEPKVPDLPFWPSHFLGYYGLFEDPSGVVIPTLKAVRTGTERTIERGSEAAISSSWHRGRTYNCMTLGAQAK